LRPYSGASPEVSLNRAFARVRPSHFLAGAFVLLLLLAGALEPLERILLEFRFGMDQRPASGSLAVVEIDAQSLHELDSWPWPRRYHAQLIDRLVNAGVKQIALDIDFSARSTPADDEALSRAIARAGDRLILATFVQGAQAFSPAPVYENRPNPTIGRPRVGMANVRAEADGRVWHYPVADDLPSGYRPSLALLLAGSGRFRAADFLIDFGIAADTIPRFSYVDILRGKFDPALLAGRNILIGSTAAELGDHLAVPIYRAVPGVLIHALAYESIVQGRMVQRTGLGATVFGMLALLLLLIPFMGTDENTWPRATAAGLVAAGGIIVGTVAAQRWAAVSVDSAAWLVTIFAIFLASIVRRLRVQAILLFRQRMAQTHTRALMHSVVEDSFDGIVIASQTGRIELANRAALRILGRTSSPVGTPIETMLPGVTAPPAGAEPTPAPQQLEITREDGSAVSIEVVVGFSELRLSKRPYERRKRIRRVHIYTFRDVTEHRKMIEAQRQALDAAVSASRAKTDFLANMSHELRTPLNAIIGFSEAILTEIFGPLGSERYRAYIQDIHGSGEHLLAIIQQVLDVSRIEAGTLTLREELVNLADAVSQCEQIIRGWLVKSPRQLTLTVEKDLPLVRADQTQLKQIILNLLSNAVKFTGSHGAIGVHVYADAAGQPTIEVTDNGIGMSQERLSRLGQPFYQADISVNGVGLGIYLVRHFVAMHGGTITFESRPREGTRVRVTLPLSRVENRRASPPLLRAVK